MGASHKQNVFRTVLSINYTSGFAVYSKNDCIDNGGTVDYAVIVFLIGALFNATNISFVCDFFKIHNSKS